MIPTQNRTSQIFLSQIVLAIFLTLSIGGCATVANQPIVIPIENERNLKKICDQDGVRLQLDQITQVVTLTYQKIQVHLLINSDVVLIGEEKVTLSEPVKMENSLIFVPADFKTKVIDKIVKTTGQVMDFNLRGVRQIYLDPGHGGKDPGNSYHAYK